MTVVTKSGKLINHTNISRTDSDKKQICLGIIIEWSSKFPARKKLYRS